MSWWCCMDSMPCASTMRLLRIGRLPHAFYGRGSAISAIVFSLTRSGRMWSQRRGSFWFTKNLRRGDFPSSRQSASLSNRAALSFSTLAACTVGRLEMARQACALTRTASSMMTMLSRNPHLSLCTRTISAQSTFSIHIMLPWVPGASAPSCGGSISPESCCSNKCWICEWTLAESSTHLRCFTCEHMHRGPGGGPFESLSEEGIPTGRRVWGWGGGAPQYDGGARLSLWTTGHRGGGGGGTCCGTCVGGVLREGACACCVDVPREETRYPVPREETR
jgi:hypothetical protein